MAVYLFNGCISDKNTEEYIYLVERVSNPIKVDADWNKDPWRQIKSQFIENFMGDIPDFNPTTEVKMVYDEDNIYVIFKVQDKYVSCTTVEINGPVWEDSCVEFFFSPDTNHPERYFNLEVNCGGTPLMHYNIVPRKDFIKLKEEEIKKITIASSMPAVVYPEITEPVIWFIEYKIPIRVLTKYAEITAPSKGIVWKVNFFKIAEKTSNPHYMTWAVVESSKPDFHRPEYFGNIEFN